MAKRGSAHYWPRRVLQEPLANRVPWAGGARDEVVQGRVPEDSMGAPGSNSAIQAGKTRLRAGGRKGVFAQRCMSPIQGAVMTLRRWGLTH